LTIFSIDNQHEKGSKKNAIEWSTTTYFPVKVLDYLNIKVECVVGYHCTTLKKPHPDPVLYCINEMGSDFNKIYGIGDSVNDIISYKRSNIISIGCLWGRINNDELIESKPDYIVNRPIDLIEILDKIL
jgi:phosphoglycolate phosphatase-like HAD superfamily hydrolase